MAVNKLFGFMRRRWLSLLAILMVFIGVGMLVAPSAYFWYLREQGAHDNAAYAATTDGNITRTKLDLGTPVAMDVPRLGIKLGIVEGHYNPADHAWRLDRTHAFYVLPGTAPLTQTAPPLIYGHDIPAVFKKFNGIGPSEVLFVRNDRGETLMFRYVNEDIVKPEQGVRLNTISDGKTLNLLTCTGRWFTERRIMHFRFVGEIKDPTKLEL